VPPQKATTTTGVSTLFLPLTSLNSYRALSPTSPLKTTTTTTTTRTPRWHRCSADRISSMILREKRGATVVVPSLGRRCSSATDTNKSSPPPSYLCLVKSSVVVAVVDSPRGTKRAKGKIPD